MRVVSIVLLVLTLIAWLLLLAGTAAYHDKANLSNEAMRPLWWGCWFEFFLLVCVIVAVFTDKAEEWSQVIVGFCAMAGAYLMTQTEFWLQLADNDNIDSEIRDSARAAAAGIIMCQVINWILLICYGNGAIRVKFLGAAEQARQKTGAPDEA